MNQTKTQVRNTYIKSVDFSYSQVDFCLSFCKFRYFLHTKTTKGEAMTLEWKQLDK